MIDFHAHVLPGLDDGPRTIKKAIALVGQAQAAGVTAIVASPHAFNGLHHNTRDTVVSAVERLRDHVTAAGLPVEIVPGMEIHLTPDVLANLRAGRAMGINDSRYLLLEFPAIEIPRYAESILFELRIAGYVPVINHPERNLAIQRRPAILENWVASGCLGVATAGSLLGWFGRTARRTAERFVRDGLIHAIVSDAHDGAGRAYGPQVAEVIRSTPTAASNLPGAVNQNWPGQGRGMGGEERCR